MPSDRELSADERVVIELASEDAYGFVEVAQTIGGIAPAQAAVARLVADRRILVRKRERWDTGSERVLPLPEAVAAIDVAENWLPRDDPSLPWLQVVLPSYD